MLHWKLEEQLMGMHDDEVETFITEKYLPQARRLIALGFREEVVALLDAWMATDLHVDLAMIIEAQSPSTEKK